MKTYLRHRIRNVIDVKELTALEFLDFEGKYRGYVEVHDFWELCYSAEGDVTLLLEGNEVAVPQGGVVLVPPNKRHAYHSKNGNQTRAFVICFDSFSRALDAIGARVCLTDAVQQSCLMRILEEYEATFRMNKNEQLEVRDTPCFGGQQALLLQLEYLLITLVRRFSVAADSQVVFVSDEHFCADLSKAVLRYLRENIHKILTLTDFCRKFNYSRSFLCKIFKEQTSESLMQCFTRLKIDEAKRLLRETARPVTDIAAGLGFHEVKYFDEVFKKQTGLTPVEYRVTTKEEV